MTTEAVTHYSVSLEGLGTVVEEIVELLDRVNVWIFQGDLGAGKTTLIKRIGAQLGVEDAMSSPSFAIVNEYQSRRKGKVFHFDFYRIKTEGEAADLGIEDYFYSGYPCFIEWPEQIPSLLPAEYGRVEIKIENESQRTIAISVHDGEEKNRV
jgi:tRNA threonylcarbamoyladenosine biosynthesis protein TsaE